MKRVNKHDYIVFNQKKVDRYGWSGDNDHKTHTHISGYNNNRKVALRIRYNVANNRIPTINKFVNNYVGKRNYIRYVESHLRITSNARYVEKLQGIIKNKKDKQEYHNKNNNRIAAYAK